MLCQAATLIKLLRLDDCTYRLLYVGSAEQQCFTRLTTCALTAGCNSPSQAVGHPRQEKVHYVRLLGVGMVMATVLEMAQVQVVLVLVVVTVLLVLVMALQVESHTQSFSTVWHHRLWGDTHT